MSAMHIKQLRDKLYDNQWHISFTRGQGDGIAAVWQLNKLHAGQMPRIIFETYDQGLFADLNHSHGCHIDRQPQSHLDFDLAFQENIEHFISDIAKLN